MRWVAISLVHCFTVATAAAAPPLDVLDPTARAVFVEAEISIDLGTVGASFAARLPATYSASGNLGTLVIPVASHEEMRSGFLTPIPGTFTTIVIDFDLTTLEATSQSASGALENGPIGMGFVQNALGTETTAGYVTGGDIPAPVFCTSQQEVDDLCLTIPAFCGATCVLVPGSAYDPATGKVNLVGSEEQQGCDGAVCSGPILLFSERGDLRFTEHGASVPTLSPGAIALLAVLLVAGAAYGSRYRPRPRPSGRRSVWKICSGMRSR